MSATGKGYAVAQTKEILAADPSIDKTGLGRLQTQLKAAIAGDMLDQFSAALRRNYPVEVNRAAIDQLFNVTGR